jgi:hypothetical protein
VGSATLAAVKQPTWMLAGAWAAQLALALWLLRALSFERGARHDEALISAIAIVGRGMLVLLLAHLTLIGAHWPALTSLAVVGALAASTLGLAWTAAGTAWATTRLRKRSRPHGPLDRVRPATPWSTGPGSIRAGQRLLPAVIHWVSPSVCTRTP